MNKDSAPQQQKIATPISTSLLGRGLQRKCACGQHTVAGGECAECRKKRLSLQRWATNQTEPTTVPPILHEVLRSPGQPPDPATRALMAPRFEREFSRVRLHAEQPMLQRMPSDESTISAEDAVSPAAATTKMAVPVTGPLVDDPQAIQERLGNGLPLDSDVRTRMESAFGTSFSHIQIHSDRKAANLSSNLSARAFTVGHNIAFGAGEYQPGTLYGDALIAHELAHTIQQGGASTSVVSMEVGDASYSNLERDADRSALHAVSPVWQKTMGAASKLARETMPHLRLGISIQRQSRTTRGRCPRRIMSDRTLTRDCSGPIEVRGNNIVLDCGGHTITGSGSGDGISLRNRSRVTVKNCNITLFENGVRLRRSKNNILLNNYSFNNASDGFDLNDSNANFFGGNSSTGHRSSNGIELDRCHHNIFEKNILKENLDGFDLMNSNENLFHFNSANVNWDDGFSITRNSNSNVFIGNTAKNNRSDGFRIDRNSDSNIFMSNTASENLDHGFRIDRDSDSNTFTLNFVNDNGGYGFFIDRNSDNNTFGLNVANNNTSDDFELLSGTGNKCAMNSFTHPRCPAP